MSCPSASAWRDTLAVRLTGTALNYCTGARSSAGRNAKPLESLILFFFGKLKDGLAAWRQSGSCPTIDTIKSRDVREVGMGIQVLAIAAAAIAIIWIIVLWGSRYFGPR
jgi:hypothetical protein